MLEAGKRYPGIVQDGGLTQLGEDNKPALWFRVKTAEGTIEHIQWCTPKAIKQARKTMQECFGTTEAQLSDTAYFDTLGERVHGTEVSITTDPDLNEKGEVVSQWMNPKGARKTPPTPATKSKVAALFGGKQSGNEAPPDGGPPPFGPIPNVPF